MQIFVLHEGVQQGPYSPDVVRSLVRDGSIFRSDLARHDADGEWMPLETLPGIVDGIVLLPRTSALAVWGLVLGILGMITLGVFALPAIICGHLSRRKIRKSEGLRAGKGFAAAGLVLGYFGPILMVAAGNAAITKAGSLSPLSAGTVAKMTSQNSHRHHCTTAP